MNEMTEEIFKKLESTLLRIGEKAMPLYSIV